MTDFAAELSETAQEVASREKLLLLGADVSSWSVEAGFERLIKRWSKGAEKTPWLGPGRKSWSTVLSAQHLNAQTVVKDDARFNGLNLLELAVTVNALADDRSAPRMVRAIDWMLRAGWNPNAYNAGKDVTALGLAAYTLQHTVLRTMIERGADPALRLTSKHTSNATMVGSTVLHRLLGRCHRLQNREIDLKATLEVLLSAGLDPHESTADGREPAAFVRAPKHVAWWSQRVAQWDQQRLAGTAASTRRPSAPPRL